MNRFALNRRAQELSAYDDRFALLDVYAQGARKRRERAPKSSTKRWLSPVIFVCFLVALLLALIFGVSVYRNANAVQQQTNDSRAALSLLSNYVHAADGTDSIWQASGPEGPSLVLVEKTETGSFETRIYLYEGNIVQEYAIAGTAYTPAKASQVVESSTFSFTYANGLLSITCDQGTADIALRSVQGGA